MSDHPLKELHQALGVHEIDRRTFLKVAGAAAVATGLSHNAAVAAPSTGNLRRIRAGRRRTTSSSTAAARTSATSIPTPATTTRSPGASAAVYDSLLRYEGNPAELKPLLATEVDRQPGRDRLDDQARPQRDLPRRRRRRRRGGPVQLQPDAAQEPRRGLDVRHDHGRELGPGRRRRSRSKVTLLKPFAPFDAVLPWLFVANPAIVQANDSGGDEGEAWLKENEAGGGPYTIKRWEIGSVYEFERFPTTGSHPAARITPLDGFVWRIIRESSTKRIAMETGELQYGDRFTPEDIGGAARPTPRFVVNDEPSLTPFAIKLNNQVGPTADINVRKALSHAFDYDAAIEVVSGRGVDHGGTAGDGADALAQGRICRCCATTWRRPRRRWRRASSRTASRWSTSTSPVWPRRSSSA